ncbi:Mitogen-activated protein kinase-binding protein 1, partial [Nowakowskiella sp. JEL0078]
MFEQKDSTLMDVVSKSHSSSFGLSNNDIEVSSSNSSTYAISDKGVLMLFNEARIMEKWVDLRVEGGTSIDVSDRYIVCGCSDGTVRLFEPITLKYINTILKPHSLGLDISTKVGASYRTDESPSSKYPDTVSVKIESSSDRVTCVYNDRSMYIWDVRDSHKIGKYRSFLYHSDCVWGVEIYPTPNQPLVPMLTPESSNTPELPVFDGEVDNNFSMEKQLPKLPPNTFVTCSSDGTVRFWNFDEYSDFSTTFFKRNFHSKELLKILHLEQSNLNQKTGVHPGSSEVD